MEMPNTLEECLSLLRKHEEWCIGSKYERLEEGDYSALKTRATELAMPRLRHIHKVLAGLPDEALRLDSLEYDMLKCMNYCEENKNASLSYSLSYKSYHRNQVLACFRYKMIEDEWGFREYGTVGIPFPWLLCKDEDLEKVVTFDIYRHLRDYVHGLFAKAEKLSGIAGQLVKTLQKSMSLQEIFLEEGNEDENGEIEIESLEYHRHIPLRNCDRFNSGDAEKDILDAISAYTRHRGEAVFNLCGGKSGTSAGRFVEWLLSNVASKEETNV